MLVSRRLIPYRHPVLSVAVVLSLLVGGVAVWHLARRPLVRLDWISASIDGLPYRVLLPAGYDPDKRYPAILYLHQYMMGNNPPALLNEIEAWFGAPWFRKDFPAIVVVPVLDQRTDPGANFGGKRSGPVREAAAIAAIQHAARQYNGDPDRLYVTGNSMGGMGAWDILLHYNALTGDRGQIFAAGLVLAGRHQTEDPDHAAQVLRGVPIWAIHGGQDREVSPQWDETMARLLQGSPGFRYTEDPTSGHDVWQKYYERPEVWGWLFAQRATG